MDQRSDQELENASTERDEVEEIQDDVVEARVQMGQTIDAIQERLSIPVISSQIKEEVSEQISSAFQTTKEALYNATVGKVGNYMGNIATQFRRSGLSGTVGGVLPIVLIGTGVGLMVMNRRSGSATRAKSGNGARTGNGSAGDQPNAEGSKVVQAIDGVKSVASDTYQRMGSAVSSTASRLGDAASSGKEMYADYYQRNPLAVGAVAAALGVAVGVALPITEAESEALGETGATVKQKVQAVAEGAIDRVKESAETLVDNIAEGNTQTAA